MNGDHDPLCHVAQCKCDLHAACRCDLIAKVRADEFEKAYEDVIPRARASHAQYVSNLKAEIKSLKGAGRLDWGWDGAITAVLALLEESQ